MSDSNDQKAVTPGTEADIAETTVTALTYVSDTEPGIRRDAKRLLLPTGKRVRDKQILARIRALVIPPAWQEVWICLSADGHIQATGRDARGRKQYLYHSEWRRYQEAHKFNRMIDFAKALPRLRRKVAEDMQGPRLSRRQMLATIVHLLDTTLIRIGNAEYAKQNDSYGLTTLKRKHVAVEGAAVLFRFNGKSGKSWNLRVSDRRLANIARRIQELPGQQLFKYVDAGQEVRTIDSGDVNDYLREIAGPQVSAKDFRTWAGTVLAATALATVGPFETQAQAKRNISKAVKAVARRLGNTVAVCRKHYIHPEVFASYLDGSLGATVRSDLALDEIENVTTEELAAEERATLRLLRNRLPDEPAAQGALAIIASAETEAVVATRG